MQKGHKARLQDRHSLAILIGTQYNSSAGISAFTIIIIIMKVCSDVEVDCFILRVVSNILAS